MRVAPFTEVMTIVNVKPLLFALRNQKSDIYVGNESAGFWRC